MNMTGGLLNLSPSKRTSAFTRCLSGVIVLAALLPCLSPARAEEPEDQYLRIYTVIQKADNLNNKGEAGKALVKYREAYKALQDFQRSHSEWNAKTVSFRLNYLTDKV